MPVPDIKDIVRDNKKVFFLHYKGGELWYRSETGFEFPVPIDDAEDAEFLATDRAMFFMRWIRKHIDLIKMSSG